MAHFAMALFRCFPHGGLQTDFLRVLAECRKRGHRVTVFCSGWEGARPEGTEVRILSCSACSNARTAWKFQNAFLEILRHEKFDLILGFNRMAGLDMYFAADSCFAADHNSLLQRFFNPRCRTYLAMEKAVFDRESRTRILALTRSQKEAYQTFYGTPEERFTLLPPGISPDCRRPADPAEIQKIRNRVRQEFSVAPDDLLFITVGTDYRTKGVDRNILAWPGMPPRAHLLVIGREKRRYCRHLAGSLHVADRVHFAGERSDVPELLFASDGMLHPARREAAGNVLAEAVAAGLPAVCTGVCGYAPLIESSGGLVLPEPFDQTAWNRLLIRFLNELEIRRGQVIRFGAQADYFHRAEQIADEMERLVR